MMKKFFYPAILASAICLASCDVDCGPFPRPELEQAEATLSATGEEGAVPIASDLRLNLSFDVKYVTHRAPSFSLIQRARACSPAPSSGFDDEIERLSLTCDKPIRGFAPGKNILTTSADVFWIRQESFSETSITLGQWLDIMNEGETSSLQEVYGLSGEWRDAYDVAIAFIPEGTDAPADDYKFTFTLRLQKGTRHVITFDTVTL